MNSVSRSCEKCQWPELCGRASFLNFFSRIWMDEFHQPLEDWTLCSIWNMLRGKEMPEKCDRTLRRVVNKMSHKTEQAVLESDQKVEDYVDQLNARGQFAVLLYSNGDLIVPGREIGSDKVRPCTLGDTSVFLHPFFSCFWQLLGIHCGS